MVLCKMITMVSFMLFVGLKFYVFDHDKKNTWPILTMPFPTYVRQNYPLQCILALDKTET